MLRKLFKSYNPLQATKSLTPFQNYFFSSRSPAQILQERGLLNQTSSDALNDPDFVNKTKEKYGLDYISTYTGYDPTADSLHLGNLLTIISVLRLKEAGIRPIFLVGGATGFIGDPSGKSKDRELLGSGELENNTSGIENTLKKTASNILLYLKENREKLGLQYETDLNFEVVNNLEFYEKMSALEFVRDLGKHFRLGVLLSKDSVSSRLESQEGMSFMEFSYQLFQANDYLNLFQSKNCVLQIGGSDQWGNITSGTDLIHKVLGKGAYALTLPLLLTSAGKKFGKSEGNAIWIDAKKTNPRDLFQFLYNTPDSDVIDLLKKFTFYSIEKINEIEKEHMKEPEKRIAQKLLAQTIVEMLNYEESKDKPVSSLQIFFETNFEQIRAYNSEQLRAHFKGVEATKVSQGEIQQGNVKLLDLAAQLKVKASKSEVRKLASAGGFSVNGKKISLDELLKFDLLNKENWMGGSFMVLQSGKKDFYLVELSQ